MPGPRGHTLSGGRGRGRNKAAETRKERQSRKADRLDARRAARLARSKSPTTPEWLVQPSEEQVEHARRGSEWAGGEKAWWMNPDLGTAERDAREGDEPVEFALDEVERTGKRKRSNTTGDEPRARGFDKLRVPRASPGNWSTTVLHAGEPRSVENDSARPSRTTQKSGRRSSTSHVPSGLHSKSAAGVLTEVLTPDEVEKQEREYLHSDEFPIADLQPARNFLEVMSTVAPIIGDSGTGWARFGPESPVKPAFLWPTNARFDPSQFLLSPSVETQRYEPGSFLYGPPKPRSSTSSGGCKFSQAVNPLLRTRHLEIDLLQRKISHGELLSLKLSNEARRSAIEIAGAPGSSVGRYATGGAGMVLWRLVRIAARVVVPRGKDEMQVAW